MGRGDAEWHADQHAHDGRKPDQRDRLHRRLPISEIGDGDERNDHERRQFPRPVHPIGERREGENDNEKRDVEEDGGEAVDQKVDQRRHRVEESGGIVLQPRDSDLNPASERHFGLGEPTLQRRPSNKDTSEPLKDRPRVARTERARSGVVRYTYRPRLFLTASSPGLPSKVVTPSSQVVSCGGLVFSHSWAAFGPSSPSVRILFITRFSISTV